jgi:hypothetical protein
VIKLKMKRRGGASGGEETKETGGREHDGGTDIDSGILEVIDSDKGFIGYRSLHADDLRLTKAGLELSLQHPPFR